jgi:hypothetical protein
VGPEAFYQELVDVVRRFKTTCAIGTERYWKGLMRNQHLTHVVKCWNSASQDSASQDRGQRPWQSEAWKGFVLIKAGYQCFPDQKQAERAYCTYDNPEAWYIELICSMADGVKGRGQALIHEVVRQATAQGLRYLTLSALPYVIMYYYQLGFRLTLDTTGVEDPELSVLAAELRAAKKVFRTQREAFEDEAFVHFLVKAVARGLSMKRVYEKHNSNPLDDATDGIYMIMNLPKASLVLQRRPFLDISNGDTGDTSGPTIKRQRTQPSTTIKPQKRKALFPAFPTKMRDKAFELPRNFIRSQ